MSNFSNYYCLYILSLFFVINTCKAYDLTTSDDIEKDLEFHVDSGFDNDILGLAGKPNRNQDVCEVPIDEGDCKDISQSTDEDLEDSENSTSNSYELLEPKEVEDRKKLNELNELSGSDESSKRKTRYFGFNKILKKCEEFYYDGCGGNENRFETINDCRKTCYPPLSYFLTKVQDELMIRIRDRGA